MMKYLTSQDPHFQFKIDELVSASFANPIYHSNHYEFYRCTQNLICLNDYSAVVTDDDGFPISGLIAKSFIDPVSNKLFLSYFSNPASLMISALSTVKTINDSLDLLKKEILQNGFVKLLTTSNFDIRVYGHQSNLINSEFLEVILKSAKKLDVEFERIIDLKLPKDQIHQGISKSVRVAEKQSAKIKTMTQIISSSSNKKLISESINNLRTLHLASSGRVTRSSESWIIQEQQVTDGSIILVNGFIDSKNVHGSLFLLSNLSAFYGVSANIMKSEYSISHVFLLEAIYFLKDIGIKNLYLGQQYENLRGVSDQKILNISRFKSFFGGFLIPNLMIKNEN